MTIDQMIERKRELGYTNQQVAELSGVPLGTVQKIFAKQTKSPRYDTVIKLEKALRYPPDRGGIEDIGLEGSSVNDMAFSYSADPLEQSRPVPKIPKASYALVPASKRIGAGKGKFHVPDEYFNEWDDELAEMFEDDDLDLFMGGIK